MHTRFLLVAASKLAQDDFRRRQLRLLLREGEGRALKKISALLAIKNFMKQVRQMKNLKQWWCRI